jgi:hypothetical protein
MTLASAQSEQNVCLSTAPTTYVGHFASKTKTLAFIMMVVSALLAASVVQGYAVQTSACLTAMLSMELIPSLTTATVPLTVSAHRGSASTTTALPLAQLCNPSVLGQTDVLAPMEQLTASQLSVLGDYACLTVLLREQATSMTPVSVHPALNAYLAIVWITSACLVAILLFLWDTTMIPASALMEMSADQEFVLITSVYQTAHQ